MKKQNFFAKSISFSGIALILSMAVLLTGCFGEKGFNPENSITVMSREDGSGTRGAFIELFGIEKKNDAGEKIDYTTQEALITNSTSVMLTNVAGDVNAIGYISLGFLNDTVKALKIDGVEPTVAEIEAGNYKTVRPFNFVLKNDKEQSPQVKDFLSYVMSSDGQKIVKENGYIPSSGESYVPGKNISGKIVLAGSSSVTPLAEKLKEAYVLLQPEVIIEIQQNDSTTGITSAISGICDIGMASRELKQSEIDSGLTPIVMARDGIAVIVNLENPVSDLSVSDIEQIFTGAVSEWKNFVK